MIPNVLKYVTVDNANLQPRYCLIKKKKLWNFLIFPNFIIESYQSNTNWLVESSHS